MTIYEKIKSRLSTIIKVGNVQSEPPLFRYVIIYNGVEYPFYDPKGWDGLTTTFSRGDYHGVNSEQSVPLLFSGDFYDLLRNIFNDGGIFSNVTMRIEHRLDDWTYEEYESYKLDFSNKYSDDLRFIETQIIEWGLRAKINANIDTTYTIDLPTSDREYLSYTSTVVVKSNTINYQAGSMPGAGKINTYTKSYWSAFSVKGGHGLSNYNENLVFHDENFVPFDTMKFYVKNETELTIKIKLGLKIQQSGWPLTARPSDGNLAIGYYSDLANDFTEIKGWPVSGSNNAFVNHKSWFEYPEETIKFTVPSGKYVELFYIGHCSAWTDYPDVTLDSKDTNIEIESKTASEYSGVKIQAISLKWLLNQILLKIDPSVIFDYSVTNQNIENILTCSSCVRSFGSETKTTITASLSDALKALDYAEATMFDVTGNTVKIRNVEYGYQNIKTVDVLSSNLKVEINKEHIYNTVKVGANSDDNSDEGNYAFNCLKVFSIQNSNVYGDKQNELEITCPYKIDMFSIDKWISDLAGNNSKSDDTTCDIAMFACKKNQENGLWVLYKDQTISNFTGDIATTYNLPYSPKRSLIKHLPYISISNWKNTLPIKWVSTDITSAITSKLGYEASEIIENSDINSIAPLFLPLNVTFDTSGEYYAIKAVKTQKYGYVETEYEGNTYKGFVGKVVCDIGKQQKQEWELLLINYDL